MKILIIRKTPVRVRVRVQEQNENAVPIENTAFCLRGEAGI